MKLYSIITLISSDIFHRFIVYKSMVFPSIYITLVCYARQTLSDLKELQQIIFII